MVAQEETSDALESTAIEVLHVSLFQERSLGASYLELVV